MCANKPHRPWREQREEMMCWNPGGLQTKADVGLARVIVLAY